MKKKLCLLLLALSLIVVLVQQIGWTSVMNSVAQLTLVDLVWLGLLQLLTLTATAKAWHLLLLRQGAQCRFSLVLACQLAGQWVESLTPSSKLGGEAARVYLLKKHSTMSYSQITASMLVSKLLSLIPFLLICLVLLTVSLWYWSLPWLVYVSFAGLFSVVVLLCAFVIWPQTAEHLSNRWVSRPDSVLAKFLSGLSRVASQSRQLMSEGLPVSPIILSTLVWLAYPLKVVLVAWSLGLPAPWLLISLAVFVAYLISMLPLLPGGLGSFEAGMTLILTLGGFSPAEALTISLITRLFTFWLPLFISGLASLTFLLPKQWNKYADPLDTSRN